MGLEATWRGLLQGLSLYPLSPFVCFWPCPHSTEAGVALEPHRDLSFPLLPAPARNKCELTCIPKGENFYYKHREAVVDGTPCEPGTRDVCVDGICRVSALHHPLLVSPCPAGAGPVALLSLMFSQD